MGQDSRKCRIFYIRELYVPTRTRGEKKEVERQAVQGHVRENPTTHPLPEFTCGGEGGETGDDEPNQW
jgi:hypothetical protein